MRVAVFTTPRSGSQYFVRNYKKTKCYQLETNLGQIHSQNINVSKNEAVFKTIDSKNIDATNTIKDVFLDVQSIIWSKIKDS